MGTYGVTNNGVAIKRLDTIIGELHDDLSAGWGVNTRLNPKSFLNVQLTAFGNKVAELWEFGEQLYNSAYPFSAEGASLDDAVQFGGIMREGDRPSYYPIHCECVDGTAITPGTRIRTDTNPSVQFTVASGTVATRSACNRAKVRVAAVQPSQVYTVALDGALYSHTSIPQDVNADWEQRARADILTGLAGLIDGEEIRSAVSENLLLIEFVKLNSKHELILSGNLTTQSVTAIVNFASEMPGDVVLPNETITQISTAVPGLLSVTNLLPHIAGRLRQTDAEVRQSYAGKIFSRSSRMLDSIKSAILNNVQGVQAVAGYQNETHQTDAYGRWPNCIEMVVDGGDDYEIAMQIWDKKTDGIQAFGSTEVVVPGDEGEPITMRFNRPEYVYIWWKIAITLSQTEPLPPNYVDAIQGIVMDEMSKAEPGKPIIPQRLIEHGIYSSVPGIAFIETSTFSTTGQNVQPDAYATGIVPISPRQRAVTDESRIGVILVG